MKQLIVPALLAVLITGCSSTPDADQNGAPVESRDNGIATVDANKLDGRNLPRELTDPKSILSKRSVYFDYDKYDVKAEYKDLVAAHAKFLTNNRQFKMLVQGNTDDRGSREYNLALGQKRADSIKKMLTLLGAGEDQVEAVSLGEEKPKNEGQDEAAWAQNRRGDMLYSGEF
ncbi:MAG: peptidoglycan-associated lipoprotein Pal [Propionivibrio sp.]